jgi:DNA-binding NarL/FixJ family response regulator
VETGQSLRVMVADDSVLFREGVARLLVEAGFAVTARVGDAPALLECVREDPPDVAIVDIRMPPTHTTEGLDAARALREGHPAVGVLVLSAHVEPQYALQLLESGADRSGYLLKERLADLDELSEAVRRIAAGGLVIDPSVVAQLVGRKRTRSPLDDLTERERQVLALMAEGHSNRAIGARMFLTERTIETHIGWIFQKLGLAAEADTNRRVLAVLAHLRSSDPAGGSVGERR